MTTINLPNYNATIGSVTVTGKFIKDNVTTPGIQIPTNWGTYWKAKLASTATGNATIAVFGDSITQGFEASDLTTRASGNTYVNVLRNALQAQYGDGGSGFISAAMSPLFFSAPWTSANTGVSTTGTWTKESGAGPASADIYTNAPGSTVTFQYVRGTKIPVYHGTNTIAGFFTVTIDGTLVGNVNSNAALGIGVETYTVAAGTHTVTITASDTNYTNIFGVRGTNSTGVIVDNFGLTGQTSGGGLSAAGYGATVPWSGGSSIPCDLFIYALGVNDAHANTGYANTADIYAQNIATTFEYIKNDTTFTSLGTTDLMIMMPHIGQFQGAGPNYGVMMERAMGIAAAYGGAFVSMGTIYRNSYNYFHSLNGFGGTADSSGAAGNDPVHPSNIGHNLYGQILVNLLRKTT